MNVAIAGYGVEGRSSYKYFSGRGHDVTILDERSHVDDLPEGAKIVLGPEALKNLGQFDMVIRTPSLAPQKLSHTSGIWSATNEFFARCPASIIGVTGTKGKGTTSSLIANILKEADLTVHLVGNIGMPALDILDTISSDDVVVFELSSFQLWDLERSPHVSVILMIEPDHLDIHADFEDYIRAKANIVAHQQEDDFVIYHPNDEISGRIARSSKARVKQRYLTPEAAYIREGDIVIDDQVICSAKEVGLLGEYNLQNICAAISACWNFTQDAEVIERAVRSFKGLEHRLEFVREKNGVRFFNDSFSSAPTATIAAITAFDDPIVLILGGFNRGVDIAPLVRAIAANEHIKHVVLIGEVRDKLHDAFRKVDFNKVVVVDDQVMDSIVEKAIDYTSKGDILLLSPGFASFDMFKNFSERGELFKQAVGKVRE